MPVAQATGAGASNPGKWVSWPGQQQQRQQGGASEDDDGRLAAQRQKEAAQRDKEVAAQLMQRRQGEDDWAFERRLRLSFSGTGDPFRESSSGVLAQPEDPARHRLEEMQVMSTTAPITPDAAMVSAGQEPNKQMQRGAPIFPPHEEENPFGPNLWGNEDSEELAPPQDDISTLFAQAEHTPVHAPSSTTMPAVASEEDLQELTI